MNKKFFLLMLLFGGFLFSIGIDHGYAQEYKETDMQAISLKFCNNGTGEDQLKYDDTLYVEPGKEKTLCLYISNAGDKKMEFTYGFSAGATARGGERTCAGDMSTGNKFSMLIPRTHERVILIEPMTYQIVEEKIVIPPGMNGLQLGCVAYKLSKPEFGGVGGMFNLIVRKVTHLDIVVGGESTVKRSINVLNVTGGIYSTNKKVKAEIDEDNSLTLSSFIENQGNISENITITGRIYNAFGFQKDFAIDAKQLNPGAKNEFLVNIGILPLYKGLFTIKFNIHSEPQYLFPVDDEKLKLPGHIIEKGNLFIFSRIRIGAIAILLLIIYKLFAPKRTKVVMVQAPIPPTSMTA